VCLYTCTVRNAGNAFRYFRAVYLFITCDKTKYMIMSRDQNAGQVTVWRLIIVPLKGWKISNLWEKR